jgi:hypothetical protein
MDRVVLDAETGCYEKLDEFCTSRSPEIDPSPSILKVGGRQRRSIAGPGLTPRQFRPRPPIRFTQQNGAAEILPDAKPSSGQELGELDRADP